MQDQVLQMNIIQTESDILLVWRVTTTTAVLAISQ